MLADIPFLLEQARREKRISGLEQVEREGCTRKAMILRVLRMGCICTNEGKLRIGDNTNRIGRYSMAGRMQLVSKGSLDSWRHKWHCRKDNRRVPTSCPRAGVNSPYHVAPEFLHTQHEHLTSLNLANGPDPLFRGAM